VRYVIRPLGTWTDPVTEPRQSSGMFRASWRDTLTLLGDEIDRIGGQPPIVFQVDVTEGDVRLDGMLRANAKMGPSPGVAVSFESQFGPLRYATDAYEQKYPAALPGWQANVRAIALALQALRAVDRYGVSKRGQQYTGWRAIEASAPMFPGPAAAETWMRTYAAELFGPEGATRWNGSLATLYWAMAKRMHPDTGGPRAEWDRLDEARRILKTAGVL
jgi:hypothetical protein